MQDLEQTLEMLQRRVAALEADNERLRGQAARQPAAEQGTSRRQMLLGGASLVGALAGGTLLAQAQPATAAALPRVQAASARKEQALRTTLVPLTSRGVHWAQHDWYLDARFNEDQPPTVIATAADDYMEHDVTASCTCSVRVQGTPGAYVAVILVRGIHRSARTVEVNALALNA